MSAGTRTPPRSGSRARSRPATIDVFLCYNSKDKEQVIAIGDRLKERGILPWLDIWEIRPGTRWQKELQKQHQVDQVGRGLHRPGGRRTVAGTRGGSPARQVRQAEPPDHPGHPGGPAGQPRLPAFLSSWHMVDMRQPDPDPFEQLVWGITGERLSGKSRAG